jgi:pimeloyl-ACP methyl ester carboxylesterase
MTDKPNLLLVPGLLCNEILWEAQVGPLSEVANVVIADATRSNTLAGMAQDAIGRMPDGPFLLAGLSLGGYIALQIVHRWPERVSRLALLDTQAQQDQPEVRERRFQLIEQTKVGKFRGVTDRLMPLLVHESRLDDTALTGRIREMAEQVGPEAFFRQQEAILERPDMVTHLAAIACPTLVICGRQDQITPLDRSEQMAELIPRAELVVLETCGHMATMEKPAEVNTLLLDWISGRRPS